MDSIITPAVVGAVISVLGMFFKEKHFDCKRRTRETKILAIRLHYILGTYAIKCAKQLNETLSNIDEKKTAEQYGTVIYGQYEYNINIPTITLSLRRINWCELDMEIISSINKIEIDIEQYRLAVSDAVFNKEVIDCDEPEYDYVTEIFAGNMVKIFHSIDSILKELEEIYKIPGVYNKLCK